MGSELDDLSKEAKAALHAERRGGFIRSLAIAFGFSAPFSLVQDKAPKLIMWVAFALPLGLAIPWLQQAILPRMRHRSFLLTILRQTAAFAILMYVCFAIPMALFFAISSDPAWRKDWLTIWLHVIVHPIFLSGIAGALLLVVPVRFIFALSQKLGPGVLRKWIRGYYHEPREEERIFMFLDMKDSTTLAEKLGHLKFSALVRDFFEDLTLPVLQTKCEVSHYIGDEAVLTWTLDRGLDKANCLRIFFEFEKSLARRSPYYQKTYGLIPSFKAGAHLGQVVATEVGEVKSEIVYHGDVLNTAARIQGLCNGAGEKFLISDELASNIAKTSEYGLKPLGEFELKGKEAAMAIWAVTLRAAAA